MGCRRIILGAGGSATNDGGTGAARALGIRFLDSAGEVLPPGGAALSRLARIDLSRRDPRLIDVSLEVATDVQNPLLGPIGASAIYGPQKGASPSDVVALEAGLARLAERARELGLPAEDGPRMGAAGGLSFGLASLCGASVTDGFSLAARELLLPQRIRDAELVLTAEGRLDGQSSFGKGPLQLALRCEALDAICVAFVGAIGPDAPLERFDRVVEVSPGLEVEAEDARVVARLALRGAVKRWARGVMRRRPN
jgi:glycerate kinase